MINKINVLFFASLLMFFAHNSMDAALKLPPVRKYPQPDRKIKLQKKFFQELEKNNIEKIVLMLQAEPFLANAACYVIYCRKPFTKKYFPPLYYAVENGLYNLAHLLITAFDADINWQDTDGNFLLDIVTAERRSEMITLLLRSGAQQTPR